MNLKPKAMVCLEPLGGRAPWSVQPLPSPVFSEGWCSGRFLLGSPEMRTDSREEEKKLPLVSCTYGRSREQKHKLAWLGRMRGLEAWSGYTKDLNGSKRVLNINFVET